MEGFDSGKFTAPLPGGDAAGILPEEADTFWEGVLQILEELLPQLQPAFAEAFGICICLILASFLLSLVDVLPGKRKQMLELAGSVVMGVLLLRGSSSLIGLGVDTVRELSHRKRRDASGLERSHKSAKGGSSRDAKGSKDKNSRSDRKRSISESSRSGKRSSRSERDRKSDRKDKRR